MHMAHPQFVLLLPTQLAVAFQTASKNHAKNLSLQAKTKVLETHERHETHEPADRAKIEEEPQDKEHLGASWGEQ